MKRDNKLTFFFFLLDTIFQESWENRQKRIQKTSPFGTHPNWRLHSVIVKSGDDLRQEQLAVQLISLFHQIFRENDIPCWLYPYYVIGKKERFCFFYRDH